MPIIIYSTPTCRYCKIAKNYFNRNGIDFTEYNIMNDPLKAQEMIDKSGQRTVPVIDLNGEILVGFNQEKIDLIINKG